MTSTRLDGKVVIVAGAGGGGIGTAVTRMVADAGAHVVAVDRDADQLRQHVEPLQADSERVTPLVADVGAQDEIERIVGEAEGVEGALYGLVCVVGGAPARY